MKRGPAFLVVLLLAAPSLGQVINGNLELPLDAGDETNDSVGWSLIEVGVDGAGAPLDTASFVGFANHTAGGDRGLWFRSFMGGHVPGGSATVDAILTQDVFASANVEYTLSAWFLYEPFYSGGDPLQGTQTLLSMEYLGAGNAVLGSSILDVDLVQARDGVWRQFSVGGISPIGTEKLRLSAQFLDGVEMPNSPQSAFVDDFSLVPEPSSLFLLALPALASRRRRQRTLS